jgi:hypothetical protein
MSHRALKLSAGAVALTFGLALFASEVPSQQKQGNELVGAW